jgi:hypothetical protein
MMLKKFFLLAVVSNVAFNAGLFAQSDRVRVSGPRA